MKQDCGTLTARLEAQLATSQKESAQLKGQLQEAELRIASLTSETGELSGKLAKYLCALSLLCGGLTCRYKDLFEKTKLWHANELNNMNAIRQNTKQVNDTAQVLHSCFASLLTQIFWRVSARHRRMWREWFYKWSNRSRMKYEMFCCRSSRERATLAQKKVNASIRHVFLAD